MVNGMATKLKNYNEIWKSIKSYNGLYEISSFGRVRSLDRVIEQRNRFKIVKHVYRGRLIIPRIPQNRYPYVHLSKAGKRLSITIHRLVANAFLKKKKGRNEVNHIDGNKTNNNVENLEWVTSSENKMHCFLNGLRKQNFFGKESHACKGIIEIIDENGIVIKTLAGEKDFIKNGFTACGISAVLYGHQKTHRGYYIRRIDK
jgi:hypothetical protein